MKNNIKTRIAFSLVGTIIIHIGILWMVNTRFEPRKFRHEKQIEAVEIVQVREELPISKPSKIAESVPKDSQEKAVEAPLPISKEKNEAPVSVNPGQAREEKTPEVGESQVKKEAVPVPAPAPEKMQQPKAVIKVEKRKDNTDLPDKKEKDFAKKEKKPPVHEPAPLPSKPLDLSTTFSEINRWDMENRLKTGAFGGREKTFDLNNSPSRYAVYFARMKERIEQGWVYPEKAKKLNLSGNLRIKFTLGRDGSLLESKIVRSSGETLLDEAALNAVKAAVPFGPFPADWELERIHVTTTFEYIRRKLLWGR